VIIHQSQAKKPCGLCLYRVGFGLTFISTRLAVNKKTAWKWFADSPPERRLTRNTKPFQPSKTDSAEKARRNAVRLFLDQLRATIQFSRSYFITPHELARAARAYYHANKDRIKRVLKKSDNPERRLIRAMRSRTWKVIHDQRSNKRLSWSREPIGCDRTTLMNWLQSKFQPGMNWNNYGPVWEVDHVKPCSNFNLLEEEEQRKCFHYTNLQPLFKTENRRKHARVLV